MRIREIPEIRNDLNQKTLPGLKEINRAIYPKYIQAAFKKKKCYYGWVEPTKKEDE